MFRSTSATVPVAHPLIRVGNWPLILLVTLAAVLGVVCPAHAQEPPSPQATSPAQLQAAIDKLGSLDYNTRTSASRLVRRTTGSQCHPGYLQHNERYADTTHVIIRSFKHPKSCPGTFSV